VGESSSSLLGYSLALGAGSVDLGFSQSDPLLRWGGAGKAHDSELPVLVHCSLFGPEFCRAHQAFTCLPFNKQYPTTHHVSFLPSGPNFPQLKPFSCLCDSPLGKGGDSKHRQGSGWHRPPACGHVYCQVCPIFSFFLQH